jgi:hypothetical protein
VSQIGLPDKEITVEPIKLPERHPKEQPVPAEPAKEPAKVGRPGH